MRGEHLWPSPVESVTVGSSPHARGALGREARAGLRPGIIPACAGSTLHDQGLLRLVSLYAFTSCKFLSPERSLLSAVFPPCVIFAHIAPTFRWSSNKSSILGAGGATNELQPVAINRLPIGLVHFKGQVLLIAGRVHHDCPSPFHKGDSALPKPFPHARRNMAHKNARSNLEKPARQIAPQAGRARRKHHHHQAASPPQQHVTHKPRPPRPRPRVRPTGPHGPLPHRHPASQEPQGFPHPRHRKAIGYPGPCA